MEIKTRREAANQGLSKYWTGRPCGRGHESPRYVTNGICCKCNNENVLKYNKNFAKMSNARSFGVFVYDAHVDDHAALLAYAQALDMARGRVPSGPTVSLVPKAQPTADEIKVMRKQAFGTAAGMVTPAEPDHSLDWMGLTTPSSNT